MKQHYYNVFVMMEKMHRLFLDVIRVYLCKKNVRDINNVQALLIYNIGHQKLTVGDLTSQGYYLGTNVSYNLRKTIENGYVIQTPCSYDRRSSEVNLSEKGLELLKVMGEIFEEHTTKLSENNIDDQKIEDLYFTLNRIETYLLKA